MHSQLFKRNHLRVRLINLFLLWMLAIFSAYFLLSSLLHILWHLSCHPCLTAHYLASYMPLDIRTSFTLLPVLLCFLLQDRSPLHTCSLLTFCEVVYSIHIDSCSAYTVIRAICYLTRFTAETVITYIRSTRLSQSLKYS